MKFQSSEKTDPFEFLATFSDDQLTEIFTETQSYILNGSLIFKRHEAFFMPLIAACKGFGFMLLTQVAMADDKEREEIFKKIVAKSPQLSRVIDHVKAFVGVLTAPQKPSGSIDSALAHMLEDTKEAEVTVVITPGPGECD